MATRTRKRNLIVSYNNLDDKLKELFKEKYPDGYRDYLQRTEKPNGDIIFCAPMETEDTMYMVKFDVKIDSGLVDEDIDKDLYGGDDDEKSDEGEFASLNEAIDQEEGNSRGVGTLRTGDYEDIFNDEAAKKEFAKAAADIAAELGADIDEDYDDYSDKPEEDDEEDEFGDEPTDDDLLNIDDAMLNAVIQDGTGMLRDSEALDEPAKRKRGRPRKNSDTPVTSKVPKEKKTPKEKKSK